MCLLEESEEILIGPVARGHFFNDTNKWVREMTRGMIDKILESAPGSMTAILLNAISFDAEWET